MNKVINSIEKDKFNENELILIKQKCEEKLQKIKFENGIKYLKNKYPNTKIVDKITSVYLELNQIDYMIDNEYSFRIDNIECTREYRGTNEGEGKTYIMIDCLDPEEKLFDCNNYDEYEIFENISEYIKNKKELMKIGKKFDLKKNEFIFEVIGIFDTLCDDKTAREFFE